MSKVLKDDGARRDAISLYDWLNLVEADAGSGKPDVMARRIAFMFAEGVPPRSIAAVTFTEAAASELLARVREFVADLTARNTATDLSVALPVGLSQVHSENLAAANEAIDEITCSTIDGFCQRLIMPYLAETAIDPDARLLDREQADLTFLRIANSWLRERLRDDQDGILAALVLQSPAKTLALIQKIAENLSRRRTVTAPAVLPLDSHLMDFHNATAHFAAFVTGAAACEPETKDIAARLVEMVSALAAEPDPATPSGLVGLLVLRPHTDLRTKTGAFASYRKKNKWAAAAKLAGLSRADGERLNDAAHGHYRACCEAWESVLRAATNQVLSALFELMHPILERYRDHKRANALLDFDDLVFAARNLLRDNDDVRRALGKRFAHVLVDDFQDADPLQTEIFWRLCGDPTDDDSDWTRFQIRAGALFLVGDPKYAIYRYSGAGVGAYLRALDALRSQDPCGFLSISN
ncbi:UvrD-helicase domain-containing protein [Hoeflea sp. IMCC20628]|uniref:UvrD-helicase domain-containing protein n=1 Tax=Hoeflea sp. IMCC20628 TaxID=1620421 RepID=UPI0031B57B67